MSEGYYYLGSPYSKYPNGTPAAWRDVCTEAGRLIKAGIPVYSPIAHTHPIAVIAGMDPLDHTIWLPADKPLMDAARGMIVLTLPGWEDSYGLKFEMKVFRDAGKPVILMEPGIVPAGLR